MLQIARADENGPIRFRVAGKIFVPRVLFNGRTVRLEYFQFVLAVTLKVIVEGFSADGATHSLLPILPPKYDDGAVENVSRFRLRKGEIVLFKRPLHALRHECRERLDVHVDTRAIQRAEVSIVIPNADHSPRISTRG